LRCNCGKLSRSKEGWKTHLLHGIGNASDISFRPGRTELTIPEKYCHYARGIMN
jgi:hypothetical protein